MNREERRGMKGRLLMRLKRARCYVTVTFDLKGEPVCSYDVVGCNDKKDIRHVVMHECASFVEMRIGLMRKAVTDTVEKMEQADRVEKAKERRSEELAAADDQKPETEAA